MLDSRSSACRIHDNDKVRDSTEVSNPPLFFVLYKALVGLLCKRENFVFGGFNIGCPLLLGITELTSASLPFYADLKPGGIDKLATKVFTIVDTNALDFMTQYNLTLAGDVNRELADGIKRVIMQGIIEGKGTDDIVRDLGRVVIYKDSFKQAGTKVFSKAQYRMEMIARTEVLRAHNMGRLKFHQHVGIKKLEWMTMGDERTCPVCGPLNGKTFPIDKFPGQPAHPFCRCTNLPVLSDIKLKNI